MLAKKIQTSFIGFTFTSLVEFEKLNMFWLLDHVPNFSIDRAANDPLAFAITEKALTRAFSWLKVPTSAFTFKTHLMGVVNTCQIRTLKLRS